MALGAKVTNPYGASKHPIKGYPKRFKNFSKLILR